MGPVQSQKEWQTGTSSEPEGVVVLISNCDLYHLYLKFFSPTQPKADRGGGSGASKQQCSLESVSGSTKLLSSIPKP